MGEGDSCSLHKGNKSDPRTRSAHRSGRAGASHFASDRNLVTEDPTDLHPVGQYGAGDISLAATTFHCVGIRSNGDPVTAHDFVRSYRRAHASLGCEYAYMFFVMNGAEDYNKGKTQDFSSVGAQALDERTLRITLNGPVPYFLSLLNHYSWWPVHLPTIARYGDPYQRNNRWTRPGNFVGNGPFVLRWEVGNVIVVREEPALLECGDEREVERSSFSCNRALTRRERSFPGTAARDGRSPAVEDCGVSQGQSAAAAHRSYLGAYFYRINTTRPQFRDKRAPGAGDGDRPEKHR